MHQGTQITLKYENKQFYFMFEKMEILLSLVFPHYSHLRERERET